MENNMKVERADMDLFIFNGRKSCGLRENAEGMEVHEPNQAEMDNYGVHGPRLRQRDTVIDFQIG